VSSLGRRDPGQLHFVTNPTVTIPYRKSIDASSLDLCVTGLQGCGAIYVHTCGISSARYNIALEWIYRARGVRSRSATRPTRRKRVMRRHSESLQPHRRGIAGGAATRGRNGSKGTR
jgi:hypothetical protein